MPTDNNKRIAKNTLMLYFRMIIVTVVALFTTRITLKILGIEDYGIYNVIGGAVGFLGILNGSMVSATQRFLAFELGRNDTTRFNQVFSLLITVFFCLAFILLLIAFLCGHWVINKLLVIPNVRIGVAMWLYFFSIITFIADLMSIPYMASIIAYEKMGIYAYMSLVEVVLKLLLVYCLYISAFDKLLTYGFLTMCVVSFITMSYRQYCQYKLPSCKYSFFWDKSLFKHLLEYTSWNLFGSITTILNSQGQAVILNLFFGPIVNAAKAIADKINTVVVSFSNNFYMAVRPQIIKSYSSSNREYMFSLVYRSTKFSYYLLFILALPLIILMQRILVLWLGPEQVTNEMILFSQLILIYSLVNVFEQPITVMIQATGAIRNYQIIIGSVTLLFLPACYLMFRYGAPASSSLLLLITLYAIAQVLRMLVAKRQLGLSIRFYFQNIFIPILLSSVPSFIVAYFFCRISPPTIFGLIVSLIFCLFIALLFVFGLGMNKNEREMILTYVNARLLNKKEG